MRDKLNDSSRIRHMIEAIQNVNEFLHGVEESEFYQNKLLFFAVVKNIEIIGEAAYMLTPDFKDSHRETPWREIVGMRHVLVHGYYQIAADEVYYIYVNDLPDLLTQLNGYLEEFSA